MATDRRIRTAAALCVTAVAAAFAAAPASPAGPAVRKLTIAYRAFDGRTSHATVLLPSGNGPGRNPILPLVISPHWPALDGTRNAGRGADRPTQRGRTVVTPDVDGPHLTAPVSW